MDDYKRLTMKDEEYGNYVQNNGSELNKPKIAVSFNGKIHGTIIDRLAELEDKIENGTLVELPCKVGDTVYVIDEMENSCGEIVCREVESCIVDRISIFDSEICLGLVDTYKTIRILSISKVFLTKADAKAKLKELNGG